jgi:hypothetical protein
LTYGIVFGDGEEEEKEIFWVAGDSSALYAELSVAAAVFAAYIAITRPLSAGSPGDSPPGISHIRRDIRTFLRWFYIWNGGGFPR